MSIRLPNSCFVHIPRTGGLWLGKVLHELKIKHQVLRGDIDSHFQLSEMPGNWRKLHSFSFVRHPLDWVKSRWSHAIEINAYEDHRHYGVHRLFDICVSPTLEQTIRKILVNRPGLVGYTYKRMTEGVKTLIATERLSSELYPFLQEVEGKNIPTNSLQIIKSIEPINGTSKLNKYDGSVSNLSKELTEMFTESEHEAMRIWQSVHDKPRGIV